MTTTPMAHHVCQCCGRGGTADFVNAGTDRWECADGAACRERSIEAARRQKAARVPLAELPKLLGDGTVETDDGKACFSIEPAATARRSTSSTTRTRITRSRCGYAVGALTAG